MQGAIYNNLNGKSGLAGWRWLFVIDFLITLPIALYGFLLFPDTPTSTRARYLTASEKSLAIERLPPVDKQRGVLGWSLLQRVLLSWHWWAFVWLWIAGSNTEMYSSNAIMQLWLKGTGDYSVAQVNYIPSSVSGMGIVATLLLGWYTDYNPRHRWHVGILLSITAITSGSLFLTHPTRAAKFAALIMNGFQYAGQTVFFAWANDLTRGDDAKRSIVIASMNMLSIAFYMWWSLIFYNTTEGPDWYKGSCAMIGMGCFLLVTTIITYGLQRRQEKLDREHVQRGDAVVGVDEPSVNDKGNH
jgi:ACS family pantothenate transporter-like MFS transporter